MFDRSAKYAFIIVCLTLVAGRLGFQVAAHALNVYLKKESVPLRSKFTTIPDRIGTWRKVGTDQVVDKATEEELGTNDYLDRVYALDGSGGKSQIMLHLSYYTGMIDAVPHVPDRCLVAAGFDAVTLPENVLLKIDTSQWKADSERINRKMKIPYPYVMYENRITGAESMLRMPLGTLAFRTTEFGRRDEPDKRVYAGYLFVANGCTTPQPESIRLLAFDRTDKYAYFCKVQCLMYGSRDFSREKFIEMSSGFLKDFLPELMRCLPDWAEVEASEQVNTAVASASTGASHLER